MMSPSEVIIELYIMPEDASFGAFSFSLKTFFFHYKGEKMSSSLSHFETVGLAGVPGPATLFPPGQGMPGAAGGSWKGQLWTASVPSAPGCGRALPCQLSTPPLAWPQRLLFLTLDSPS